MEFNAEEKERIQREILEIIAAGLESGQLTGDDPSNIALFVLERIDTIKNSSELATMLEQMTGKWPLFSVLLEQTRGQVQDRVDDEVADGVEMLIKQGKLERALALVKSITKKVTPPY